MVKTILTKVSSLVLMVAILILSVVPVSFVRAQSVILGPPTVACFIDTFEQWHQSTYGQPLDRPWTYDADTLTAGQNIVNDYNTELTSYNQQYGTNIQSTVTSVEQLPVSSYAASLPSENKSDGGFFSGWSGIFFAVLAIAVAIVAPELLVAVTADGVSYAGGSLIATGTLEGGLATLGGIGPVVDSIAAGVLVNQTVSTIAMCAVGVTCGGSSDSATGIYTPVSCDRGTVTIENPTCPNGANNPPTCSVCTAPQTMNSSGVCTNPVPTTVGTVLSLPQSVTVTVCSGNQTWNGSSCVSANCTPPQTLVNGVCTSPATVCTAPQTLVNGVCTSPTTRCTAPQTLVNGVCTSPTTSCTPPQTLVNGVCTTPSSGGTPGGGTPGGQDGSNSNNQGGQNQGGQNQGNPSVAISAEPNRVRSGDPSTISWTLNNVNNCAITKNGTSWKSDISSSGESTPPEIITVQTTYTITCPSISPESVTVNILPIFQEF